MGIMKTLTINGVTYDIVPVVPAQRVTLRADAWVTDGERHSQVVTVPGVTVSTKVDLQPTPEQLAEFHYKVLAFVAENDGGIVTVYSIGDKPADDHTIQVTLTEVNASGKIRGNTVGTTMPRTDFNQTDDKSADYLMGREKIVQTVNGNAPDENGNVVVSGGGGSSVQSDWNQNDSTQPDYVKNRPFYTGDAIVETEICDIHAMSKTALALWIPNDGLMTNGFATKESEAFIFDGIIEVGKRYVIVANGTRRTPVVEDGSNWNSPGTKMLGDVEAFASGDIAHLEMLLVIADAAEVLQDPSYDGKSIMYLAAFAGSTAPTEFKLYSREEEIIKLDPKYLPELPEYISKPTKKVRLNFLSGRSSMTPTEIVNAVNLGFDVIFTDTIDNSCRWWDISGDSIGLIASEDGYPVLYKIDSSGNLLRVNGLELKPTSGTYITNTSADQTYAKKIDLEAVSDLVGTTPVSEQINTALGVIENGSY